MHEERIKSNPGPLSGGAHLTLQTHHGARLLRGRLANKGKNKPAITGLMAFASQLKPIWAATIKEDPYAEWWLCRIEQSIIRSRNALRDLQARLENALGSVSGLEIPPGESTDPVPG